MIQEPLHVKILGGGQNWMAIGSRIAIGLGGYTSPLPKDSSVDISGQASLTVPRCSKPWAQRISTN